MPDDPRPASRSAEPDVELLSQDGLAIDTHQIIAPDGSYDPDRVPDLSAEALTDLYRWMVLQRTYDERATKLQRRGRMGTLASGLGHEASVIGSVYALSPEDTVLPYGREAGGLMMHGVSLRDLILYWRGVLDAGRMEGGNVLGMHISVGAHTPLAMGLGWGMRLDDADRVAFPFLGDGATSTGAFHEAINTAGVMNTNTLFFCLNNQYAISMPFERQTNADTVAQKALAYGVDGIRVDGNDVLAVYEAVRAARERASRGNPVLVESLTYRRAAHTTSDDPTRYRDEEEVDEWAARDPIDRYEAFLKSEGLFDRVDEEAVRQEVQEEFDAAVEAADAYEEREIDDIFEYMYEELTPELRRQLAEFEDLLERRPELYDHIEQRPKG